MTDGVVREIDKLGRLVMPVEYRKALSIKNGDTVSMSLVGDHVEVRPCRMSCVFCGAKEGLVEYKSVPVCDVCLGDMGSLIPEEDCGVVKPSAEGARNGGSVDDQAGQGSNPHGPAG